MTILLNHSYFFIEKSKLKSIKFTDCKTKLMDSNNIIVGLINIPTHNFYKKHIIYGNYLCNNIKIQIELDTCKLSNYVSNNKTIPNKQELCFLLKKHFIKNYTKENDIKRININKLKNNNKELYFNKHFIKLNDLIIDIKSNKFYKLHDVIPEFYSTYHDISIIYSYPNINSFKKILLNKKKVTIVYNKSNLILINYYIHSIKNTSIELLEIDSFIKENTKKTINLVIFFDLNNTLNDLHKLKNLLEFQKIIIINHKNLHISNEHYFNLFINYNYLQNINIFNKCITYLSNNTIVFSKKIFKDYKVNTHLQKIINNFNKNDTRLYHSLRENVINFNNFNYSNKYKEVNCNICFETIKSKNSMLTHCNHLYCEKCLLTNLLISNKCPKCRGNIVLNQLFKKNTKYSDKLNYIMKNIEYKKKILVLSYYNESLKTIKTIISSNLIFNDVNKYIKLTNIKHCLKIKDFTIYDKILILENNYSDFDYYKYLFLNKKKIKQKIEILI